MERPKIDNYIKKDPSELTTGEILIGYQKYAKALNEALTEQLRIGGVSQQRELLYAFANYVNNNELKSNEQITDYSVKKYIKSLQ
ncbi:hypothetical protein [Tenacibaculum finnmarkense]|uniref:hypothetical protein n=1 Tax=Tenacibaculum finnmarkense TaxID=2781243 RepID=UPI003BB4D01E